ncbi:ABC-type sugar transport system, periplasmic component [Sphaerochaeta pleomorpha str. Grapes]|uniref:ABC-type sugar transport system, periplasmic component n=1 Tax=Sphaerochaeta pleomorpha (strain ATCC BAA-1885 / DSM 22778 / Grapes) TaxID=158190 RepID=G8QWA1_SPHPG|nr:extracellular solute-binding protein [Sphaerochaeta pleomorpha]AEV29399.1 ABC-type sugar transport system, periplasmic component [Sphaerochaeta pleomorpha str. Grapes]
MKKKLVLLVLLTLFCVSVFANGKTETPAGNEGPVSLTWMLYGDNTPTEENSVIKALEEKLGIDLTVIYVPEADYMSKLNTLIAARNLPDVFWMDGKKLDVVEFRDQGMLMKLDSLLDTYGQTVLSEVSDNLLKSPVNQKDGIYALTPASLNYTSNLSIRTDWLKNLGMTMPTNLDELYMVLDAFSNKDPDGNGIDDTVGYIGTMASMRTFEHIFGAFGICVDMPYLMDNGTVTTYMKAPLYLDAIKYLRKLYQNGLLDSDFATMPLMSAFEKLWTGRTGVFDFQNVGTTNNWMPGRYTEPIPPTFGFAVLAGPGGKGGAIKQYPRYQYYNAIASTCKNPEKAMELINYLYGQEGDELTYLGIEGVHYSWVDKENGKFKLLNEFVDPATYRADGAFVYNHMWPLVNTEVRTLNKQTQEGQAFAREHSIGYPNIIQSLDSLGEYGSTLRDITKEAFAQLIVTKGNLEAEYKGFVERWNNEGGLEFEKEATAAYAAQLAAEKLSN